MKSFESAARSQQWLGEVFGQSSIWRALALGVIGALLLSACVPEGGLADDLLRSFNIELELHWRMSACYVVLYALWFALIRTNYGELIGTRMRAGLIGLGVGLAFFVATRAGYPLMLALMPAMESELQLLAGPFSHFNTALGGVMVFALIIPGEELIWRSGVTLPLMQRLGPWKGLLIGSLLFGLAHAGFGSPLLVLVAMGAGALWGWLAWWQRSAFASLVSHIVWDALLLYVLPIPGMSG